MAKNNALTIRFTDDSARKDLIITHAEHYMELDMSQFYTLVIQSGLKVLREEALKIKK